ncbi:mechanosensitive ion channel family protein, partial [bacterium]|nr:mechanosensitive ion channel family protein [bacterium]
LEDVSKLFNITYGIFITYIAYKMVNAIAKIKVEEIATENKKIKNEVINVSIKILNFVILIIGLLIMLHFGGVNLTAILSGLGIGGLAVALAAKDSLANFFGTLSILLSDVFSQGDWIVVGNQEGVVVEIGLRVTTIRTFDNALVAIPNAVLANQDVKNWTKRMLGRRIKMNIGIKYNSKSQDIKNAVNQIREMLHSHPGITTQETEYACEINKGMKLVSADDLQGVKKDLLVYMDEFTSSNINILVYCFTKSTNWAEWLNVKEDVMHKIMGILEENSLEFAFPSMSIYQENQTKESATS